MKNEKIIVAIGGGEIKARETLLIDKYLIKQSKKNRPRVLFVPTASGDSNRYAEIFKEYYEKNLKCKVDNLFLLDNILNKQEIEEKIFNADIIYVGGGNTLKMLKIWRKKGVDKILREAYDRGIILSGLSAGAICWFRYGVSDSRSFIKGEKPSLMRLKGLDIVSLTVSPHHICEKRNRDVGMRQVMMRTPRVGLAIDDYAALVIKDNHYEVIRSKKVAKARKIYLHRGKIKEIVIEQGLLRDLIERGP